MDETPGREVEEEHLKAKCYLCTCKRGTKQSIKERLAAMPEVQIVTDHGPHIKVITSLDLTKWPVDGFKAIAVKNRTTHFDIKYWYLAMEAFRYSIKKKHTKSTQALRVLIHYLCNLYGVPEKEFYGVLAADRYYIDATWEGDEWETKELEKAGMR